MWSFGQDELIHDRPIVIVRPIEVNRLRLRASDRIALAAILHRPAIRQHPVQGVDVLHQRRRIGAHPFAVGLFRGFGGQIGVEARQCLAPVPFQHHIVVVRVSGFSGGGAGAMRNRVAKRLRPPQGGVVDNEFGDRAHEPT